MEQSNEVEAQDTEETAVAWPLMIAGYFGIIFAQGIAGAIVGVGFSRPWRYSGLNQAQAHSNMVTVVCVIALAAILIGVYKKFGDVEYAKKNASRNKVSIGLYVVVATAAVVAGYFVGVIDERAFTSKIYATFILVVFPLFLITDTFLSGRYIALTFRAARPNRNQSTGR